MEVGVFLKPHFHITSKCIIVFSPHTDYFWGKEKVSCIFLTKYVVDLSLGHLVKENPLLFYFLSPINVYLQYLSSEDISEKSIKVNFCFILLLRIIMWDQNCAFMSWFLQEMQLCRTWVSLCRRHSCRALFARLLGTRAFCSRSFSVSEVIVLLKHSQASELDGIICKYYMHTFSVCLIW